MLEGSKSAELCVVRMPDVHQQHLKNHNNLHENRTLDWNTERTATLEILTFGMKTEHRLWKWKEEQLNGGAEEGQGCLEECERGLATVWIGGMQGMRSRQVRIKIGGGGGR